MQFYSIYDKKSAAFMPPFHAKHISDASRTVSVALDDTKSALGRWPGDFALYLVSHWDGATGGMSLPSSGGPQLCCEVSALLPIERQLPNA